MAATALGGLPSALASPPGAPVADAAGTKAPVRPLQRRHVLRTLGIPPLKSVRLTPVFKTGFEQYADLAGFYATPQSPLTRHGVQSGNAHSGKRAHVGWLTGVTGAEPVDGPNHRGYPTIQLQRRAAGPCISPCLIQFWARADGFVLHEGEWLSLATLSPDASNRWSRVITVNVGWEGWLHLFHVPDQGIGERVLQRTDRPLRTGRGSASRSGSTSTPSTVPPPCGRTAC